MASLLEGYRSAIPRLIGERRYETIATEEGANVALKIHPDGTFELETAEDVRLYQLLETSASPPYREPATQSQEAVPPEQTPDCDNPDISDTATRIVEKVYSTQEAAQFFEKSNQWIYWGLREKVFTYPDGSPIEPTRIGKAGRRRFTLPILREMALSWYRRGNVKEDELKMILHKISKAEHEDL
jgi:hypothetical protein